MKAVLDHIALETETHPELGALYVVKPYWKGVDRPYSGGWATSKKNLAQRLQKAVESGTVWLGKPEVKTDINGKTYVNADITIYMRHLAKELTARGF